jgi:transposase
LNQNRLFESLLFEGSCDKSIFTDFIISSFKKMPYDSFLILDNARIHNVFTYPIILEIMKTKNIKVIFLPPYSPDFNPIEKAWGWIKNKIRKVISVFESLGISFLDVIVDAFNAYSKQSKFNC